MKFVIAALLSFVIPVSALAGDNGYRVVYDGGSLPDVKTGTELKMHIETNEIRFTNGKTLVVAIPASAITEISYGQDVHRRVGTAVGVAMVSFGIGILVALSKSKKHYVGLVWADGTKKGGFAMQCDKNEYRGILAALEGSTGKKAVDSEAMNVSESAAPPHVESRPDAQPATAAPASSTKPDAVPIGPPAPAAPALASESPSPLLEPTATPEVSPAPPKPPKNQPPDIVLSVQKSLAALEKVDAEFKVSASNDLLTSALIDAQVRFDELQRRPDKDALPRTVESMASSLNSFSAARKNNSAGDLAAARTALQAAFDNLNAFESTGHELPPRERAVASSSPRPGAVDRQYRRAASAGRPRFTIIQDGKRTPVGGGQGLQPLTNDSILKLVRARVGDDAIVNIVNTQPGNYSLGTDDVIALKRAGVSDRVFAAILNKSVADANQSSPSPVPVASASATEEPDASSPPETMLGSKSFAGQGSTRAQPPESPGLYYDNGGEVQAIIGQAVVFRRTGSLLADAVTFGIVAGKVNIKIPGKHAETHLGPRPIFYYHTGPNDPPGVLTLVLSRLKESDENRQLEAKASGAWRTSEGISINSQIQTSTRVASPQVYKIEPLEELKAGEYAFYLRTSGASTQDAFLYAFSVE